MRLGVTVPYVTELELLEALRRGDERAFREETALEFGRACAAGWLADRLGVLARL